MYVPGDYNILLISVCDSQCYTKIGDWTSHPSFFRLSNMLRCFLSLVIDQLVEYTQLLFVGFLIFRTQSHIKVEFFAKIVNGYFPLAENFEKSRVKPSQESEYFCYFSNQVLYHFFLDPTSNATPSRNIFLCKHGTSTLIFITYSLGIRSILNISVIQDSYSI